ncbi:MAG: Na+/H+ antiporter subunit C [Phycisphaerales bacterium]|nr:MAG: Na+/H+ antiporter subunit C [Phycisphaerales bacterium]
MEVLLAILIGGLYASGLYLMMRRSIVKLIVGLAILGHAANLLVFTAAGLTRAQAPLVAPGEDAPPPLHADPLPQALVLTAIVISFAVLAFTMVLFKRAYQTVGEDDLDQMKATDT